ncbi:MAG: cellulase family glycosylhydrolase [Rikenellaceae bacterium]
MIKKLTLLTAALALSSLSFAQKPVTYVDKNGICRYSEDNKEVTAFGLNYTLPFSASYRLHSDLNLSIKESIDADVYHFTRMNMDLYRIHVWECQFTDKEGNLVQNDHLYWFDYLIAKLKEHNVKVFLTPLSFNTFNNDGRFESFVDVYGEKAGCLKNRDAYPAQERYLEQLVSHINPFTGKTYAEDENIIAYEICNEPNVGWVDNTKQLQEYIERMKAAIRKGGSKVPVLYNVSGSSAYANEICATSVEGVTMQWYPTGLFERRSQFGNFMPHTDKYMTTPLDNAKGSKSKTRFVYEYSPSSDHNYSALYPAMARSFREAGVQAAAYFAYDAMQVAHLNMNYASHYLSFVYTPSEAMGMKIASEIFHSTPLYKSYGRYPDNLEFDHYKLDAVKDYAQMVSDDKFFYTEDTNTNPKNISTLKEIAGVGSSPIVSYEGNGIYLLDKLEDGVWRLEVMPDAVDVYDVMTNGEYSRSATVNLWRNNSMTLNLPDIGKSFNIEGLNSGNKLSCRAENGLFSVTPGAYLIYKDGKKAEWNSSSKFKTIALGDYYAPAQNCDSLYVMCDVPSVVSSGSKCAISAQIATSDNVEKVMVTLVDAAKNRVALEMQKIDNYNYSVDFPQELASKPTTYKCNISVVTDKKSKSFPTAQPFSVDSKGFNRYYSWDIEVVDGADAVEIFDAEDSCYDLFAENSKSIVSTSNSIEDNLRYLNIIPNGVKATEEHFSIYHYAHKILEPRNNDLASKKEIVVDGYALSGENCELRLSLIMLDGSSYDATIKMIPSQKRYIVSLDEFKLEERILIPNQFPSYQRKSMQPTKNMPFSLNNLEQVQFNVCANSKGVAVGRIFAR